MKKLISYILKAQLKIVLVVLLLGSSANLEAQKVFNGVYDIDSSFNFLGPIVELENGDIISGMYAQSANIQNSYLTLVSKDGVEKRSVTFNMHTGVVEQIFDIILKDDTALNILGGYFVNNKLNNYILTTDTSLDSLNSIFLNETLDTRGGRILRAPNGGHFFLNWFMPDTSSNYNSDIAINHIDSNGILLYQWTYGTSFREGAVEFRGTLDKGFIIAGQTDSTISGENDFLLIKLDSLFNTEWLYTYGNDNDEIVRTHHYLELSRDGGYLICGSEILGPGNDYEGVILKVDSLGILEWRKNLSQLSFTNTRSIREWPDGSIIVVGGATEYDSILPPFNSPRGYLLKLSADGNTVIWERYFSKYWDINSQDYPHNMILTQDGGILVSGWQAAFSPTLNDGWLVKFDSCGYTVGAEPEANFIIDSIVDSTVFITNLSSDYCIATLYFDNGDSLNLSAYRNQNDQIQYTFSDTGTYIPYMYAYAGDGIDTFGAKGPVIIQSDTSTGFFSFNDIEFDITVYPNPAHDYFVVSLGSLEVNGEQDLQIRLYTPTGRLVRNYALNPDLFQQQIYTTDLISGIYLLNFTVDGRSIGNKRLSVIK